MAAVTETQVSAPPERVFEVLGDPSTYQDWVVGAADIRDADAGFPAPGTTFHHTQGIPGLGLKDSTTAIRTDPARHLELEVRARPLVVARVVFDLEARNGGTRVVMTEQPVGGWLAKVPGQIVDRLIHLRNAETLRRLKKMSEGR